jgi:hypothetical protein
VSDLRVVRWPERPKSEAELCERFAVLARRDGWTVYPETGGFDQLLVDAAGVQIGVEAKLRCSYDVLLQAAPPIYLGDEYEARRGPDYRAVLVPEEVSSFAGVAALIGLCCYELRALEGGEFRGGRVQAHGRLWPNSERLPLPDYVPDLPAGVPSPKRMSSWLVAALRLCKLLRQRGHVTIYDFEDLHLHMGLWTRRWLDADGRVPGRRGRSVTRYRIRPGARLPDEDVPERTGDAA